VEFRILGPLTAVSDGVELDLGRPKQRAVLAVLLIHRDRVVSLDHLADLLWDDEGVARAIASLRIYISNLRRILEPERGRRAPCQVLVTQAPGYRLRIDPDDLDAARFESLAARGAALLGDGRPHEACETLTQALALARGPALAEFAFERFADAEAARLAELRAVVLEQRLEAELALGRHAASVAELEGLVAERPLREGLWGLLMVALYRSGRQADALRAFSAARHTLAEEVGIDPGPDLRRLESDILAQSPTLDWHPPERQEGPVAPVVGSAASDAIAGPAAAPLLDPAEPAGPSLVGRQRELECLATALETVMAGRGRLVLVAGEPGIGKTRLVEELANRAEARGAMVTWGRCQEVDGAPPYWPWVQVLRAVLAQGDQQLARKAMEDVAGEIAQILPEVKELGIDIIPPPPLDPSSARFRLHRTIVDFLGVVAANGPLVIVLDDVHWADVASLELIRNVAAEVAQGAILVIATYRDVDPPVSGPLADLLGLLARHPALDRLMLAGLSRTEVAQFIAQTADTTPTPAAVATVHARTEGNPFFVAELARLLVSEGLLDTASSATPTTVPVPVGVRDVIRRRLARLPEETGELLAVAAVIGREFDFSVLAEAADINGDLALDLVDVALAAGIVREQPLHVGRYVFSHALIRDTVYGELTGSSRARIHGRVGAALEHRHGSVRSHLAELALHFTHAAPVVGPLQALSYTLKAADAAQDALAYEQAEDGVRRALSLVDLMPVGPPRLEQELDIQNRLAALLTLTRGQADPEVGRACARARQLAQEVGRTDELIETLAGLILFHFVHADFHIVAELAEQILSIGEQHSKTLALELGHFGRGLVQPYRDKLSESRASFAKAVALARTLELTTKMTAAFRQHPLTSALCYVARNAWIAGDHLEATAANDEAVQIARRLAPPYSLAFALYMSAQLAVLMDDGPLAEERAMEAVASCETHGFAMLESWSKMFHGWAIAEQGRHQEGVAEMTAALAAHHATGARINTAFFLGLLADGERRCGHDGRALAVVEEALLVARTGGERLYESDLCRRRGELLAAHRPDRVDEARASLDEAISIAEIQGAVAFKRRAEAALSILEKGKSLDHPGGSGRTS